MNIRTLAYSLATVLVIVGLKATPLMPRSGLVLAQAEPPICNGDSEICRFLKEQYAQGKAAGNKGDRYINDDGGHADFSGTINALLPQVTTQRGSGGLVPGQVEIANASVSLLDPAGAYGSVKRVSTMQSELNVADAYAMYRDNKIAWHPAVGDYLDANNFGDGVIKYPGEIPAPMAAYGFSGHEGDELLKMFYALAAFRSEVKTILKERGLLMPTLRMIGNRARVATDAQYLTGAAHPLAFTDLDNTWPMVQLANAITTADIPPMVQLTALDDNYNARLGSEFFETNISNGTNYTTQRAWNTPTSIGRIWRGFDYTKHIRVSAAGSFDVNNHPLTYHWVVLQGDPNLVRILPEDPQNKVVTIEFDYHPEKTRFEQGMDMKSNLVVVGAFVNNGSYYSTPGYVTSFTLRNESRSYDSITHKLNEIAYPQQYTSGGISTNKLWGPDVFSYDANGNLTGWERRGGPSGRIDYFTPEGYVIVARNANRQVTKVQRVSYYTVAPSGFMTWRPVGLELDYPVPNDAPTIATPASARPNPLTNVTRTDLRVLGADSAGEANLTYYWSVIGAPPAPVAFSVNENNIAKNTTAVFSQPGSYTLRATVRDEGGLTATSDVTVTVDIPAPPPPPPPPPAPPPVPPPTAQIVLSKTVDKTTAKAGETLNYTIEYKNVGDKTATNIIITDAVPIGSSVLEGSISDDGAVANDRVTWSLPNLAPNLTKTVSFQVAVK